MTTRLVRTAGGPRRGNAPNRGDLLEEIDDFQRQIESLTNERNTVANERDTAREELLQAKTKFAARANDLEKGRDEELAKIENGLRGLMNTCMAARNKKLLDSDYLSGDKKPLEGDYLSSGAAVPSLSDRIGVIEGLLPRVLRELQQQQLFHEDHFRRLKEDVVGELGVLIRQALTGNNIAASPPISSSPNDDDVNGNDPYSSNNNGNNNGNNNSNNGNNGNNGNNNNNNNNNNGGSGHNGDISPNFPVTPRRHLPSLQHLHIAVADDKQDQLLTPVDTAVAIPVVSQNDYLYDQLEVNAKGANESSGLCITPPPHLQKLPTSASTTAESTLSSPRMPSDPRHTEDPDHDHERDDVDLDSLVDGTTAGSEDEDMEMEDTEPEGDSDDDMQSIGGGRGVRVASGVSSRRGRGRTGRRGRGRGGQAPATAQPTTVPVSNGQNNNSASSSSTMAMPMQSSLSSDCSLSASLSSSSSIHLSFACTSTAPTTATPIPSSPPVTHRLSSDYYQEVITAASVAMADEMACTASSSSSLPLSLLPVSKEQEDSSFLYESEKVQMLPVNDDTADAVVESKSSFSSVGQHQHQHHQQQHHQYQQQLITRVTSSSSYSVNRKIVSHTHHHSYHNGGEYSVIPLRAQRPGSSLSSLSSANSASSASASASSSSLHGVALYDNDNNNSSKNDNHNHSDNNDGCNDDDEHHATSTNNSSNTKDFDEYRVSSPTSAAENIHIAFLQLSPISQKPLNLTAEKDKFKQALNESNRRIRVRFGVGTVNNFSKILTTGARVFHFSGHGHGQNLVLENDSGEVKLLNSQLLRSMLDSSGRTHRIKLVFISACFSSHAALAFVEAGVSHVVAVQENTRITDEAARKFAEHFYLALCSGKTVQEAFNSGISAVKGSHPMTAPCCCAHTHTDGGCSTCPRCGCAACCKAHAAQCHEYRTCCQPQTPHDESLKFLLLPANQSHDEVLLGDVEHGAWQDCLPERPHNIPSLPEAFKARIAETLEVFRYVTSTSSRLTTIVGVEGVGKTALARAVTRHIHERRNFGDGVYWVQLSDCARVDQLIKRVAGHLGLTVSKTACTEEVMYAINSYLHDKHVLLVWDDCHILMQESMEAFRDCVQSILDANGRTSVLITARQSVDGLNGVTHRVWPLRGLPASDAVTLFVDRLSNPKQSKIDLSHRLFSKFNGNPRLIESCAQLLQHVTMDELDNAIENQYVYLAALKSSSLLSKTRDLFSRLTEDQRVVHTQPPISFSFPSATISTSSTPFASESLFPALRISVSPPNASSTSPSSIAAP